MGTLTKAFKYRAYCNRKTEANLLYYLYLCRQLYNVALEQRITLYKQNRKSTSYVEQSRQLTQLKKDFPEYKEVGAHVLQATLKRLDLAFQHFFHRCKTGDTPGFPRFKGANRWHSIHFPDHQKWKVDNKRLVVKDIGSFRLRNKQNLEGTAKTLTLKQDAKGRFYAYFVCTDIPTKPLPKTQQQIGIDLGLSNYATFSDGTKIENPRHFRTAEDRIKALQQNLSIKVKGSNRYRKAKRHLSTLHQKVTNQRRDFHFKLALLLVRAYDIIAVEDLKPSTMNSTNGLNKSKSDAGWSSFLDILAFKAVEAEKQVVKVDPAYTSKICSQCGAVKKDLKLSDRIYRCDVCGLVIDRDHNAALNIMVRAGPSVKELGFPLKPLPRSQATG